jgi:hypothetical protein
MNRHVLFFFFIWITFNESTQRFRIYVEYFSCNDLTLCEIFSQEFLRILHVDDNDDEDEIHIYSKKSLFWFEKKIDNQLENQINTTITITNDVN